MQKLITTSTLLLALAAAACVGSNDDQLVSGTVDESGAPDQIDLTEEEAAAIEAIVISGPRDDKADAGGCAPLVTDHIKQKHIGKTDAQLKERSRNNGGTPASSWAFIPHARNAQKNLLDRKCNEISRWTRSAAVGASKSFYKSDTGISARYCVLESCKNVFGIKVVFTKFFSFAGYNASFITTAYPVQ